MPAFSANGSEPPDARRPPQFAIGPEPEWIGGFRLPSDAPPMKKLSVLLALLLGATSASAAANSAPATPATFPFPPRASATTTQIEGAFLRVESSYFNGRLSLRNQGWFFTADGRVSLNPTGGFDLAAFKKAATAQKSDGVYAIAEKKLTITWASGQKPSTYSYDLKPDGTIMLGGLGLTRIEGFKRGWRVAARYEGGSSAGGSGSYVGSSNSLELRRDGTFGTAAVGSVSAATSAGTVSAGSQSSQAGTYEFDGYTLTLKHADGREERRTVFAFGTRDAEGAPEFIWREGTMLRRRDAK